MNLHRSYANVGTSNELECCHMCKAGGPGIAFEYFSESPKWLETEFSERPWSTSEPPELSTVQFDQTCPEYILKPDVFHILKLGVARDIIGGVLILLMRLRFFDYDGSTVNIDDRCKRAHSMFALWCQAMNKCPGLRSFSKSFFNMKSLISAPWVSAKASDCMLLLS